MHINDIKFGSLVLIVFIVNVLGYLTLFMILGLISLCNPSVITLNGAPATNYAEAALGLVFIIVPLLIVCVVGTLTSAALFRALSGAIPKILLEVADPPIDDEMFG